MAEALVADYNVSATIPQVNMAGAEFQSHMDNRDACNGIHCKCEMSFSAPAHDSADSINDDGGGKITVQVSERTDDGSTPVSGDSGLPRSPFSPLGVDQNDSSTAECMELEPVEINCRAFSPCSNERSPSPSLELADRDAYRSGTNRKDPALLTDKQLDEIYRSYRMPSPVSRLGMDTPDRNQHGKESLDGDPDDNTSSKRARRSHSTLQQRRFTPRSYKQTQPGENFKDMIFSSENPTPASAHDLGRQISQVIVPSTSTAISMQLVFSPAAFDSGMEVLFSTLRGDVSGPEAASVKDRGRNRSHVRTVDKKRTSELQPLNRRRGSERFSNREDMLLVQLKEEKCLTWDDITRRFPGRSKGTLQVRYSTKLKRTLRRSRKS